MARPRQGVERFEIENPRVRQLVEGLAARIGEGRAATLAQRALCALGAAVPVDGRLGPRTISAINASDPGSFEGSLVQQASWVRSFTRSDRDLIAGLQEWSKEAAR